MKYLFLKYEMYDENIFYIKVDQFLNIFCLFQATLLVVHLVFSQENPNDQVWKST